MEAERLMVLYGDGAVEVRYAGGSRLLLSPCGCEYLHEAAPPAAAHPLQPAGTSRQRVAFAVSAYRVRGGSALSGPVRDGGSSPGGRCLAAAGGVANRVCSPPRAVYRALVPVLHSHNGTAVPLCEAEGIAYPLLRGSRG